MIVYYASRTGLKCTIMFNAINKRKINILFFHSYAKCRALNRIFIVRIMSISATLLIALRAFMGTRTKIQNLIISLVAGLLLSMERDAEPTN